MVDRGEKMEKDAALEMMARNKANNIQKLKESAPFIAFLTVLTIYASGLLLVGVALLTYFTYVLRAF